MPADDPTAPTPSAAHDPAPSGDTPRDAALPDTPTRAPAAHTWRWRALAWAALLTAFVAGAAGIDYGKHWDEWQHLDAAEAALLSGRPLPLLYNYPSLTFDLVWLSALTQSQLAAARADGPTDDAWLAGYLERREHALQLRARLLFLALALLAGAALFELGATLAGPAVGALAAGLLAGSHEYLYHARWITPDGLLASAVALCLAGVAHALRTRRAGGLWFAALAAGFAAGAKYTGVFLVLPVMLAVPFVGTAGRRAAWVRAAWLAVVAAAVFFATTPGALLETGKLLDALEEQRAVYAAGHRAYAVDAGWPHLHAMALYAGTQLFDRAWSLNLALAALASLGALTALRRHPRFVLLVATAALPYLALLVSHRTFIVRNLLPWLPLVALCVALGVDALARRLPGRGRRALGLAAALLVLALLGRRVHDGLQIRAHADDALHAFRLAHAALSERPELRVFVAKDVGWRLNPAGLMLPNAVSDPDAATHALILPKRLPTAWPSLIEEYWGVHDVNYRYYHSWHQRKPALVSIETARRHGELESP